MIFVVFAIALGLCWIVWTFRMIWSERPKKGDY